MAFNVSVEFEALRHDVNSLFSRFIDKQSVRFEDFSAVWREANFSIVFVSTWRITSTARMRIVERLFRAASEYLSPDSLFLYRVAAVYLFYAVYFKQITEKRVKIRMTPKMWQDLMNFLKTVTQHQHLDVAFVIRKLMSEQAFVFTAFPKPLIFGRNEFMMNVERTSVNSSHHLYEVDEFVRGLTKDKDAYESIGNEYNKIKDKLLSESKETEKAQLSKVLFYSNSEFSSEYKNILELHTKTPNFMNIPKNFSETQRPFIAPLIDLNAAEAQKNDNAATGESQKYPISEMAKFKEKLWKKDAPNTERLKSEKAVPKQKIMDAEGSVSDDDNTVYKRGAMLQPRKQKVRSPHKARITCKNII